MTQLVIHAHDGESGSFGPAYTVCRLEDRTLVRALRSTWVRTASEIEKGLTRARGCRPPGVTTVTQPAGGHSQTQWR